MGGEDSLGKAPCSEGLGLPEALQGCAAGIGKTRLARFGSEVAMGEAGVVMRWTDEPVKIDFPVIHGGLQVRLNLLDRKRATGFCN